MSTSTTGTSTETAASADKTSRIKRSALTPVAPTRCGKYMLVAKLGHGGMAEVYLAVASGMAGFQKLAVVKRIHPQLLEEPEFVQMFLDEARLAARLNHPNVVQTYEVDEEQGLPFIAMEHLEGQSLDRVLKVGRKMGRPLTEPLAVRMMIEALDGIHYAHSLKDYDGTPMGVVHRDISPSNLFLTYQGTLKILDFGIAKANIKISVTRTGRVKGKFAYMAPEQARGAAVDARADVWSMAVTLWELLAQKRLFKGETEVQTLENLLKGDLSAMLRDQDNIPEELVTIIEKGLRRNAEERYSTAAEMRDDLDAYLNAAHRRVTAGDLAEHMRDLFSEVIAAHHQALGELLQKAGAAEAAPVDVEVDMGGSAQRARSRPALWGAFVAGALALGMGSWWALGGSEQPEAETGATQATVETPGPPATASAPVIETPDPPKPDEADKEAAAAAQGEGGMEDKGENLEEDVEREAAERARRRRLAILRRRRAAAEARETPSPPVVTEKGFLTLVTTPWSEVVFRGKSLGTTPLIRVPLPAGTHTLTLKNPEQGITMQYPVTIRGDATTTRRLGLR